MFWWRKSFYFENLISIPITCSVGLRTTSVAIARWRAAAMTKQSLELKMSLHAQIKAHGMSASQVGQIMSTSMRAYVHTLTHIEAGWKFDGESDTARDLAIYEGYWMALSEHGLSASALDAKRLEKDPRFVGAGLDFTPEELERLQSLATSPFAPLQAHKDEAELLLAHMGIAATPLNLPVALNILFDARRRATHAYRLNESLDDAVAEATRRFPQAPVAPPPPAAAVADEVEAAPLLVQPTEVETKVSPFAQMTPLEFADHYLESSPKTNGHRVGGKRANTTIDEHTCRNKRWAAALLQKSMEKVKVLAEVTNDDLIRLDGHFDKISIHFGKAPHHKDDGFTLEMAAQEALEKVDEASLDAGDIGLSPLTTNKHFRYIRELHDALREHLPALPALKIDKYIVADARDARNARDALTVAQGKDIFNLPPWVGHGEDRYASKGTQVIHDALFYVLMLVWYSGARREEICKLQIDDVRMEDGIHFIDIKNTDTGRVKNAKSVRRVPICEELQRLGFLRYRDAMFEAGETLLFPEIQPSGDTKRSLGDVFYKVHWIYLKPFLPSLKRGQAMHSVRHTVATELKHRGVSSEVRRDLLGHSGAEDDASPSTAAIKRPSNETESRYSKSSRLETLKDAVDKIPIVTAHIATVKTINLLPTSARRSRRKRDG